MLLSFCVLTKSAGRPDNEKKQRRHLNSALHEGDRGWGMEIGLKVARFFPVWGKFSGNAQMLKMILVEADFRKTKNLTSNILVHCTN